MIETVFVISFIIAAIIGTVAVKKNWKIAEYL
jgi:hypothetical protein